MHEFLNSKSNLTPGILGGLCMLLGNTLINAFGMDTYTPYVFLSLSFILGMTVFADKKSKLYQKIIFYLINSLVIFSIAIGSNSVGDEITSDGTMDKKALEKNNFFNPWP